MSKSSISSRHQRVRTRLQKVQYDLERLEMNEDSNLANLVSRSLERVDLEVSELQNLAQYESPVWKARVELLVSETNETKTALQQIIRTKNFDQARRDIMNDLESGTSCTNLPILYLSQTHNTKRTGGGEQAKLMDQYQNERESINRSGRMLNDYIDMARNSLDSLHRQRDYIKGFQRTLYSMGNTLGLSQGVMRIASRRNRGDKILVYGGMIFTLIFIYLFWSWRTSRD